MSPFCRGGAVLRRGEPALEHEMGYRLRAPGLGQGTGRAAGYGRVEGGHRRADDGEPAVPVLIPTVRFASPKAGHYSPAFHEPVFRSDYSATLQSCSLSLQSDGRNDLDPYRAAAGPACAKSSNASTRMCLFLISSLTNSSETTSISKHSPRRLKKNAS